MGCCKEDNKEKEEGKKCCKEENKEKEDNKQSEKGCCCKEAMEK